ncbi:Phosphatidylinositol 4,5-bisphosphate 5-phosphatase A [Amphibalanus amphitrite]|uniref:Phosphatidylinositol 4,5-bisphosphate 5-phosphatase A n=1 Tax=Amphibalanus amphitrite TaxID=1232801 RepID=A0A6A4VDP8_AMPAM|nr:Phosphatidylinositol 4,5-bisphosphate 5-phosphatase A [Amphibalanus amphitrite]
MVGFVQTLASLGYVKLRTVRVQGIVLSVLVRRRHLVVVRHTEEQIVRLGLGGMWGNKGAVALRLSIMGVNLCLVNAHLTAHDHLLSDRVRNYGDILEQANFQDPATSKLLYHDYLIWLGDLNFRLAAGPDDAAVRQMAYEHDLTPLLALDQLRAAQTSGEAFSELSEPTLTFKPTYKLVPGRRGEYAHSRRPAWTDRILYKVNEDVYEGARLSADPLSYQSHPEYTGSDHCPVSASFSVKVFSGQTPPCVEFLPISMWLIGADCVAKYRVDPALETSSWDWIALFRADFAGLDEYISYIWVPRSSSSPNSDHFVAVFPEDSITVPGNYVLAYCGRNGGGVYGVSAPFPVRYGHTARLAALALDGAPAAELERRPLLARAAPEQAREALELEQDQEQQERDQQEREPLLEGRPVLDDNPGPARAAAGGGGAGSEGETDGVPRRRIPGPAAAAAPEPPLEDWETVERPSSKEE